ncbi:hypothetical protein DFH09DRAFT_1086715 [Mycena vulgaris]|nr:hypothetical protein DFH09DRAFT_1086715 [Mycena vulgaris]
MSWWQERRQSKRGTVLGVPEEHFVGVTLKALQCLESGNGEGFLTLLRRHVPDDEAIERLQNAGDEVEVQGRMAVRDEFLSAFSYHTISSVIGITRPSEVAVKSDSTRKKLTSESPNAVPVYRIARVCDGCRSEERSDTQFSVCKKCNEKVSRKVYYGSRPCQVSDWPTHKKICDKALICAIVKNVTPPHWGIASGSSVPLAAHWASTQRIRPFSRSCPADNPVGIPKFLPRLVFRLTVQTAMATGDSGCIAAVMEMLVPALTQQQSAFVHQLVQEYGETGGSAIKLVQAQPSAPSACEAVTRRENEFLRTESGSRFVDVADKLAEVPSLEVTRKVITDPRDWWPRRSSKASLFARIWDVRGTVRVGGDSAWVGRITRHGICIERDKRAVEMRRRAKQGSVRAIKWQCPGFGPVSVRRSFAPCFQTTTTTDSEGSLTFLRTSEGMDRATAISDTCLWTVRHLLIGDFRFLPAAGVILSTCTGIENLWIHGIEFRQGFQILASVAGLPLTRLYCDVTSLFDGVTDFTHPLFSNIRHLQVFYLGNGNMAGSTFALIPHLSHLSFQGYNYPETKPAPLTLLQKCRSLRVLIYLRRSADVGLPEHACDNELAEHPHFFYITSEKCRSLRVLIYLRRSADVGLPEHACDNELAEHPHFFYITSAVYVADQQMGRAHGPLQYYRGGWEPESALHLNSAATTAVSGPTTP